RGSMIRESGYTGADRHRTGHSRELPALHQTTKFLGDGQCMLWVGLRQQDGELFSTVTADNVNFAQLLVKDRGHLAEDLVSEQVSEFIVEAFELIDIDHQHGHSTLEAAGAIDFLDDTKLKEPAVEDARKAVEVGQLLDTFYVVRVLDRGRADVGHGFERIDVAFMEGLGFVAFQHQDTERLSERDQRDAHARLRLAIETEILHVFTDVVLDQRLAGGEGSSPQSRSRGQTAFGRRARSEPPLTGAHDKAVLVAQKHGNVADHESLLDDAANLDEKGFLVKNGGGLARNGVDDFELARPMTLE